MLASHMLRCPVSICWDRLLLVAPMRLPKADDTKGEDHTDQYHDCTL